LILPFIFNICVIFNIVIMKAFFVNQEKNLIKAVTATALSLTSSNQLRCRYAKGNYFY